MAIPLLLQVIPPFKTSAGGSLSNNKTAFNTLLAKPRVKSEHCIGLLKCCFPFLKGIRLLLGNKIHLTRIIDHVRGTVILHNFLLSEPVDPDWLNSDEGDNDLEPEVASTNSNQPDNRRRAELLYYLSELEETSIN